MMLAPSPVFVWENSFPSADGEPLQRNANKMLSQSKTAVSRLNPKQKLAPVKECVRSFCVIITDVITII